ncbi:MAG: M48 family metalloprotease [Bacteroidetes bacterium]|nr:M48 family metalloprotease [Bacteroidota bacterium]
MTRFPFLYNFLTISILCFAFSLKAQEKKARIFENDETEIWKESQIEQRKINESGLIYQDDSLEAYLNNVLIKVTGIYPEPIQPKIKVLKSPVLNAFAYPNGVMYIHSGLLAKMENESQLATLLGHEITHSTNRHAVLAFRSQKSNSDALAFFSILSGGFGLIGAVARLIGEVGYMASVSGYSQELEKEADGVGFQRMKRSGYNVTEAPKLFGILKRDLDQEPPAEKQSFFFSSHPKLDDRIKNYNQLLNNLTVKPDSAGVDSVFIKKTRKLLFDNIGIDIQSGRYNSAHFSSIVYATRFPSDYRIYLLQAEIMNKRFPDDSNKQTEVMELYKKVVDLDSTQAEAQKNLGKWHFKKGDYTAALPYLEAYLKLSPDAKDKGYIEGYLRKIKTSMDSK